MTPEEIVFRARVDKIKALISAKDPALDLWKKMFPAEYTKADREGKIDNLLGE